MRDYRSLRIWQQAMDLCIEVYDRTDSYPRDEIYLLTRETRRSAISIPSNIAEGAGKRSDKAFSNHLDIGQTGTVIKFDKGKFL